MLPRPPSLAFLTLLLVQLLLLSPARSQLLGNNLPACAKSCAILEQAQGSCESNPSAAQSCFCQSALLTPIKNSNSNLCAPACSDADWGTIASWYKSTCANGGANPSPTQAGGAEQSPTSAAAAAAATTAPAANSNQGSGINQNQTGPEW
jgi:hypothetical protein